MQLPSLYFMVEITFRVVGFHWCEISRDLFFWVEIVNIDNVYSLEYG